jgi:uncharacterized membrane protein YhiD involved in acid resistance
MIIATINGFALLMALVVVLLALGCGIAIGYERGKRNFRKGIDQ